MSLPTPTTARPTAPPATVEMLRQLLGSDVVLLPVAPKTKRPMLANWPALTVEVMDDPNYLRRLAKSNIGVLLGHPSSGVCSVDVDDEQGVSLILGENDWLGRTLQSVGARGRNFWLRCQGEYPPLASVKFADGRPFGEWRSDGGQTVISGIHPSGCRYRLLNNKPPMRVAFGDLVWPPGVVPPAFTSAPSALSALSAQQLLRVAECSERTECSESTELQRRYCGWDEKTVAGIVSQCAPKHSGSNHKLLFQLARGVKSIERDLGKALSTDQLELIFDRWHAASTNYLRAGQSRDDYFFEFLDALRNARHALDENSLGAAWLRSESAVPPPEAKGLRDPRIIRLICLCRELQKDAAGQPFFLACRTVEKLFAGNVPQTTASLWLRGLVRLKIIEIIA